MSNLTIQNIIDLHELLLDSILQTLDKQKIEFAELRAEFAATKERLDHLEATVNHEE